MIDIHSLNEQKNWIEIKRKLYSHIIQTVLLFIEDIKSSVSNLFLKFNCYK